MRKAMSSLLLLMRRVASSLMEGTLTKEAGPQIKEATYSTQKLEMLSITTMATRCSSEATLMSEEKFQPHSMWKSTTSTHIKSVAILTTIEMADPLSSRTTKVSSSISVDGR